jgi:hypothetical protein
MARSVQTIHLTTVWLRCTLLQRVLQSFHLTGEALHLGAKFVTTGIAIAIVVRPAESITIAIRSTKAFTTLLWAT